MTITNGSMTNEITYKKTVHSLIPLDVENKNFKILLISLCLSGISGLSYGQLKTQVLK